jgi:DNA-binding transcriptional LysR family regulator
MDRLEAMSTFLAVVDAGSLSAAARRLNTPLATVSRKVSDLESHLRAKLFNRSSHKLVLTEAGSSYVAACRRILTDVAEAERGASGEFVAPTGDLTVTAPVALGRIYLVSILAEFLRVYPKIDVHLVLNDRVMSLSEELIDVALRIGELPDSSLMALRLGAIRRVFCASPAYLAAHGTPRTPRDLAGHDCISYPALLSPNAWTFSSDGANVAVRVHSRLVVSNAEAACEAACAGIGITAVFSYHIQQALEGGRLTALLADFEPPTAPVSLVYEAGRFLPIKVRAFLDFAAPRLRAKLPQ